MKTIASVFEKLKKEIRQNWEWNLSQDEDSEGDILIIKMKSLKPIIDQAQEDVERIHKRINTLLDGIKMPYPIAKEVKSLLGKET